MEEACGSTEAGAVAASEMLGSSDSWPKSSYRAAASISLFDPGRRERSPSPLLSAMEVLSPPVEGMPFPLGISPGACHLWVLKNGIYWVG
jgi:hypothetical protein